MPYNPSSSNISGQLIAQGISQGVAGGVDGYKQYKQNQAKDQNARGVITAFLNQFPDAMTKTADEKTRSMLEKFKEGNTGLKDNIFLAGWAAMSQKAIEEKQQAEMRNQQMKLISQQVAESQRQQKMQEANAAALRAATQPRSAMGSAIQAGGKFGQLPDDVTPQRPGAAEVMERFMQAGGTPSTETNQFFNVASDLEARSDATNARLIASQKTAQDATLKNELLQARITNMEEMAKLNQAKLDSNFKDGAEKPVTFNGKTRTAVFSNGNWLDKETMLPIATKQMDPTFGNVVAEGVPNPVLFGTQAPASNTPWGGAAPAAGAATPAPGAKPATDAGAKKFEKGKVYKDAKGNRAKYLGDGKWQNL